MRLRARVVLLTCLGMWLLAAPVPAQQLPYAWVLLAGGDNTTYRDGVRHLARFRNISDVARDAAGNLYVTDIDDHVVRHITRDGTVTTLAGLAGTSGSADGMGSAARFFRPDGIAVDANGVVFVADSGNYTIRRIASDGTVTTWAGTAGVQALVDGQGTEARFTSVRLPRFDASGHLITADAPMRRISPSGTVTTMAASVAGPVAIDPTGYLFVREGYALSRLSADGVVSHVAGHWQQRGTTDGVGLSARFLNPVALTPDSAGGVYVVEHQPGLSLRRVTPDGTVTTIPTFLDSAGTIAELGGVAVPGSAGSLVFAGGRSVKSFTPGGPVENIAGSPGYGSEDGLRDAAQFYNPQQIALDHRGTLFVADTFNHMIRRVSASTGQVTGMAAGRARTPGYSAGFVGVHAGLFRNPYGVTVRPDGTPVVSDTSNGVVRTLGTVGFHYTGELAGAPGEFGTADGLGNAARFGFGAGTQLASDAAGTVYITDPAAHTIRRITTDGVVTTLASGFNSPKGIAVGHDGLIYIADATSVRRMTPAGVVTTVGATRGGTTVAVDIDGSLLVGDGDLYRLTMDGVVTVIGNPDIGSVGGVAVGSAGEVYLSLNNVGGPEVNRLWVGLPGGPSLATLGDPRGATITAGRTAQFVATVTGGMPRPELRWQESTDGGATWRDLYESARYTGVQTPTLSIGSVTVALHRHRYRLVATSLAGQTTSAPAQLSVIGLGVSSSAFTLAARLTAAHTLVSPTPPVVVAVTSTGVTDQAWTATANQPWLHVTNGSGIGDGRWSAGVATEGSSGITAPGKYSGVITLQSSTSGATAQVLVTLTVIAETASVSSPFGIVETPVQDAEGVVGAIGVTGWALDDIGVASVKLYRNCVPSDAVEQCAIVAGHSVVFLGDAAFLPGARPDLEYVHPTLPNANRAGWGFMVLTSMLPHVPNQQSYGGQGSLMLYAVATDAESNTTLLGRTHVPGYPGFATPTRITMANDSIAKPFGAIDTPAQGATVTGVLSNFGWVLTPDSNTVGGEGSDLIIPTNGSTVTVFIDAMPVGQVSYNLCRGDVGSPVPAGQYCNDDVSNIFGTATPRPTLSARTSNPTRFRNLDAGRSAIGLYSLDTHALSNGLHSIAWGVTDSAGRAEGIGSRFFNVFNSGADQSKRPAVVRGLAGALDRYEAGTAGVSGRTGFDLSAAWIPMQPDARHRYRVRLSEMGRLELWLGATVDAAYLVGPDGTLRDLPVGSSLRGAHFGWMPPVGYVGPYALAFIRGGERIDVDVTVAPMALVEEPVRMHLDSARTSHSAPRIARAFRLEGWAFDPHASIGSGIGAVHVWAKRRSPEVPESRVFLGVADLGVSRPDVAAAQEGRFLEAGFTFTGALPEAGVWEVTAYVWSIRTQRFEDARTVTITVK